MKEKNNDWDQHKLLILDMKERNERDHEELHKSLECIRVEMATLKERSSMWGGMSGLIVSLATIATFFIGLKK